LDKEREERRGEGAAIKDLLFLSACHWATEDLKMHRRCICSRLVGARRGLATNATTKDIGMPTPLSLGFDITYQPAAASITAGDRKPLVILCGWMGAKPRQMKVFLDFYHKRGFDALLFAVGPKHVLLPSAAEEHMKKVVELALQPTAGASPPSSLVFHHFSVGGYLFGQMLRGLEASNKLHSFSKLISAQIFDSPPDIAGVPAGLARSMGIGAPFSLIIEYTVKAYLAITKLTTGKGHELASQAFHQNTVPAPSLWFYSEGDDVADYKDCEIVIEKWRAKGTLVEMCTWKESKHIQHARFDPAKYFGTLDDFLKRHKVINA